MLVDFAARIQTMAAVRRVCEERQERAGLGKGPGPSPTRLALTTAVLRPPTRRVSQAIGLQVVCGKARAGANVSFFTVIRRRPLRTGAIVHIICLRQTLH